MASSTAEPSTSLPPYSDTILPLVISPTTTLFVLALTAYSARMYTRIRPHLNLSWDDLTMTLAIAIAIANYGILLSALIYSGGRHIMYIPESDLIIAFELSFISDLMWLWAGTFIKVSICFMLLRIKKNTTWLWGIWTMVMILFATAIASTLAELLQCSPVRANWEPALRGTKCWSTGRLQAATYTISSIFIATDVACALLPLAFIRKLNRPLREKVVLFILMGLGLFASACGIVKLFGLKKLLSSTDPIYNGANIAIWTYAEEYIGIIAACIPCLRRPLERIFKSLGGRITSAISKNQSDYHQGQSGSGQDTWPGHGLGPLWPQTLSVTKGKELKPQGGEYILLNAKGISASATNSGNIGISKQVEVS